MLSRRRNVPLELLFALLHKIEPIYALAIALPSLYLFPKETLLISLCAGMFLLGLLLNESLVPPEGSFYLVEEHYQARIKVRNPNPFHAPQMTLGPKVDVTKELEDEVDLLISYIVRDFIDNLWYSKINHSKSTDFPDSVKAGLKQVFVKLGYSLSQLNHTDLLLAVVKVIIVHVRSFKEFDVSGLDMTDFLKQNSASKFNRLADRESIINLLRDISMKLCIFLLPKSEASSMCGFAIVQEVLATTVFLPLLEKVSDPDLINSAILSALVSEGKDDRLEVNEVEEGYLNKRLAIEDTLKSLMDRIAFVGEKLASGDKNDDFLLEEKILLQTRLEELHDLQGQEQLSPTPLNKYYDLKQCFVMVKKMEEENTFLSSLSSVLQFELSVQTDKKAWVVEKTDKEFAALDILIQKAFPRVSTLPKQVDAEELMVWLSKLVKDPVILLYEPFLSFLNPPQVVKKGSNISDNISDTIGNLWKASSAESLQNAFQASISSSLKITQDVLSPSKMLSVSSSSGGEQPVIEEKREFTSISQDDLAVVVDVLFSSFEELFSISGEQWIASQSLSLIKVILKRAYSSTLSSKLGESLESLTSQPLAAKSLHSLNEKLWPKGRVWGSEANIPKSRGEIEQTKHQLWCLLNDQEGVLKKDQFEKVTYNIGAVIGAAATQKGFSRGFLMVQNRHLTLSLLCEVLEVVTDMVIDNKT